MSVDQAALARLRIERASETSKRSRTRALKSSVVAVALLMGGAGASVLLNEAPIEVETAAAVLLHEPRADSAAVLNASGYVVARRQATVSSKTTGQIADVSIEEGMAVRAGQVLARLDDTTSRALYELSQRQLAASQSELREIEVRVAEATRTLGRAERLFAQQLVSEAQLDTTRAELGQMQARLAALTSRARVAEGEVRVRAQQLDDLIVRAPFDGVVVSKDAQPGEMVSPVSAGGGFTRTGIATIVDMDSREIEVDVNEAFIKRVTAGQAVVAVLDAYPDRPLASHVINIVPTADRQRATVRVRIGFDAMTAEILPDMGVKVSFFDSAPAIQEATPSAIAIPTSSIFSDETSHYVWLVRQGKLERAPVDVGEGRNGQTLIRTGLTAGDIVVKRSVPGLQAGATITTRRAD